MEQTLSEFRLRVVDEGMSVMLDCMVSKENINILLDVIQEELAQMKIKEPPDKESLRTMILDNARENPNLKNLIILRGRPPVPSRDGGIEWSGDFFNTGYLVDEKTGAIDYRRPAAQLTVEENELLARLIPPKLGKDGVNVYGETVPSEAPRIPQIRVGNNIRVDKEDRAYYAKLGGRIRWVNETLSVDPVYFISESVGLKTGHIFHTGTVVVKKDVLEGAIIEATGDVEVMGMVEAAEIHAGGNLIVRGGIARVEDLNFTVQGNLNAKFILDSKFRVNGDIEVEREIVNSHLKTLGSVIMPNGRIVGGEISARQGIILGQAGTRASVPTVLIVGEDFALPGKLLKLRKKILAGEKEITKMQEELQALLAQGSSLLPEQQEHLDTLQAQIADRSEANLKMQGEMESVQKESRRLAKYKINVKRRLYQDTILCMGTERLIIKEEHNRSIHATLAERRIVFL